MSVITGGYTVIILRKTLFLTYLSGEPSKCLHNLLLLAGSYMLAKLKLPTLPLSLT